MAEWSVEIAAAGTSCDLELANWTMEPSVCSADYKAVEHVCTEKFGGCLQSSVPISEGGQVVKYDPRLMSALRVVANEYDDDINKTEDKINRYPASIQSLDLSQRYTVPMLVAIGPYYHYRYQLQPTEKVKLVAAYNLVKYSNREIETLYNAVVAEVNDARKLYDKDVVEGIDTVRDFQPMMFLDACFLVQYMRCRTGADMDGSLRHFFDSNDEEIFHDIMLLENQLPWPVVQAIMKLVPVPLETFIAYFKGCLQDRKVPEDKSFISKYEPPHLLGLIRYYIVGERKTKPDAPIIDLSISFSLSAIELAEMGIKLKPSEKNELVQMSLKSEGNFFPELSLAPLSLNRARGSLLVNMAALELCTTSNFGADDVDEKESAVCSYLLLLAMLVGREEDVQELRARGILQGGGFTNEEALEFFTNVQGLRLGSCYLRVMKDIENYRVRKRTRANLHTVYYRNFNFLAGLVSSIATIITIIGTYLALKK